MLKVKIDWDAYDAEQALTGKPPVSFTVHGFNSHFRARRERITFIANKKADDAQTPTR